MTDVEDRNRKWRRCEEIAFYGLTNRGIDVTKLPQELLPAVAGIVDGAMHEARLHMSSVGGGKVMIPGFTPVVDALDVLIREWAEKFVWSGRDASWMKGGPRRTQEEANRRIDHHCEYLRAWWKRVDDEPWRAHVCRKDTALFTGAREVIEGYYDELEEFLNERLNVMDKIMGVQLDTHYHVVEDAIDRDHLTAVLSLSSGLPAFKHFSPRHGEVVIDVSQRWAETAEKLKG